MDFFSLLFLNNINPFIHMLLPSMLENGIEAEEMSFYPLFSYVMGKEEKKKWFVETQRRQFERERFLPVDGMQIASRFFPFPHLSAH